MSNYRILLRGVKQGRSIDEVARALSRYSKKSPEALRSLLRSGKYLVAKRTAEARQATHYKRLLDKLGCDCIIEAEITASAEPSNTTSVLVTDFTDGVSHAAGPARRVTYVQRTRFQEMTGSMVQVLRSKALAGLVFLLGTLYLAWRYMQ